MLSEILVEVSDPFKGRVVYKAEIPSIYQNYFEPLSTQSEDLPPIFGISVSSAEARVVNAERKCAAKELGDTIATFILRAMKAKDRHNGYPIQGEFK